MNVQPPLFVFQAFHQMSKNQATGFCSHYSGPTLMLGDETWLTAVVPVHQKVLALHASQVLLHQTVGKPFFL